MLESLFLTIYLLKPIAVEQFPINEVQNTYIYTGPIKIDAPEEEQIKIRWIWDKTHDLDMILTFERESGFKNVISKYNSNGTRDYGETQLNSQYHSNFIFSEKFKDWRQRLDYGIIIYNNAKKRGILNTTFYAYPIRYSVKNRFDLSNLDSK